MNLQYSDPISHLMLVAQLLQLDILHEGLISENGQITSSAYVVDYHIRRIQLQTQRLMVYMPEEALRSLWMNYEKEMSEKCQPKIC